jgi:hypothetical protein
MNQHESDGLAHPAASRERQSSREEPGWATVVLIVAFLTILSLSRTIPAPGLSPIIIVSSAVVLVFWIFGGD